MSSVSINDERRSVAILCRARRIVFFTGAGVSAESGIPTFRDANGLWKKFPPEQFASWAGISKLMTVDPIRVAQFLIELLRPILLARPNAGHVAIAELEKQDGVVVTVVTQNIDRLHQRAGSTRVIELHGSIFEVACVGSDEATLVSPDAMSGLVLSLERICADKGTSTDLLKAISPLAGASLKGFYRPNVILFGDLLPTAAWKLAEKAASDCDCMLVIGTSQVVQPAASLPDMARSAGATIIGIGPEPIRSDVWLRGNAAVLLPRLLNTSRLA